MNDISFQLYSWKRSIKKSFREQHAKLRLLKWRMTPKRKKDEFDPIFDMDHLLLVYLPEELRKWYLKALLRERQAAHERSL